MLTPSHTISASIITLILIDASPNDKLLIWITLVSATLPDIDHAVIIVKDWVQYKNSSHPVAILDKARSVFHEIIGVLLVAIVMLCFSFIDPILSLVIGLPYAIHLTQDFLIGTSYPLRPISDIKIRLAPQSILARYGVELITITLSLYLWGIFLAG